MNNNRCLLLSLRDRRSKQSRAYPGIASSPRLAGLLAMTFVLILCLIPSPSHAKRAPDWLEGTSNKYPEPRYFIGVGSVPLGLGGERQQMDRAGDKARAEIAKILRSDIEVETRSERLVTGASARKFKGQASRSLQSEIVRASAAEILEGVEIKQYYRDKRSKMLYALAVLDRIDAAKRIEKAAVLTKERLLAEMDAGEAMQSEKRYLPAISHFRKAMDLASALRKQNELIGVMKPTGPSSLESAPNYEVDIAKIIGGIKDKIRFTMNVTGPGEKVKLYIIQGLSSAGYTAKAEDSKAGAAQNRTVLGAAVYQLNCVTDVTYKGTIDMGKDMLMQIYQADLDIEVVDPSTKEIIGTLTWSVSANEKSAELAEKSAVRALGRHIKDEIADKIATML